LCEHHEWTPHSPPCTGDLEITLGWYNAPENTADLDLYLLGPDGLRVYWGMMEGPGEIRLEQDATNQQGFVFENICAPNLYAMPRGLFKVRVNNFDGQDKRFQARIIRGNYLQQYYGVISPGESVDLEVFRLR
jgi:uncharacterized protein YfaP (DUF2135 family)